MRTKATIGFRAEPAYSEGHGHFDCIFALAEHLDAVVWNGSALLTSSGTLLVNAAGESEQSADGK
jgi:hypothetical protein